MAAEQSRAEGAAQELLRSCSGALAEPLWDELLGWRPPGLGAGSCSRCAEEFTVSPLSHRDTESVCLAVLHSLSYRDKTPGGDGASSTSCPGACGSREGWIYGWTSQQLLRPLTQLAGAFSGTFKHLSNRVPSTDLWLSTEINRHSQNNSLYGK